MTYDIIVIGAGLGGLTAGAKLAKEGKKVLLLEQHDRPGGCATTFKRRDFTMEVGLHEMDGLHPRDLKTRIFRDLGIFDRVEFLELPEFYRFINERKDLVIPHDPEKAKQILMSAFPGEEQGIDDYFHHVLNARKIIGEQGDGPEKSVGQFLDEIITNEDLKLVLLGNLGYFHDDPYSLSWLYYLTAQGSYYGGRANFIKDGSQQLSNALMDIIRENGGVVKLKSLVTGIDYKGKKPAGVTYMNVKGKEQGTFSDIAGEIIINAAIPILADSLLSKSDILKNNHSEFSTRSFTFVDYSQVDSALAPEGKGVGAVCCVDYPSDWEGLNREEYNRMKADVADTITDRCDKIIPGFRDAVEYVEVATSLSVKRFTLNPQGAVYGFAQNPGKPTGYLSALPENIHIASAWGKFGGGFSGAILSGYMTAFDLLRKAAG